MESTDDDRRPIPAHHRIDVHRCPVTRRSVASSDFRNSQNNVPASALIKTRLQPDDHMFIEIATRSIDVPQPGGRKQDNNSICLFSYRHLQQSIQSAGSSSLQVPTVPILTGRQMMPTNITSLGLAPVASASTRTSSQSQGAFR